MAFSRVSDKEHIVNLELLQNLTQAFGPSGYESEIRDVIRHAVTPLVDEVRVDPLGSLVAIKKGAGGGKRILLAAHMDEIGVMVTHVDKQGYLRFTRMGGVSPLTCIGGRVRFANGTLGVIYVEHREDRSKPPTLDQLFIDVGATGPDDAPVGVGETGVFARPLELQGDRLISKTLDDRIGCYVLISMLKELPPVKHDLFFVFSVQEEITLSGARTAAYTIDPDMAIAIDVTSTGDTPKALPMAVSLGKGPAIKVKDAGMVSHPEVRQLLITAAQKAGVPYQMEILQGGSTDAAAMQLVRAGVPSGCVSIPCRYVHSPSEMVAAPDVEHTVQLLLEAVRSG
ncbi:MAG: M42 family metallopeptidase [Anaerolineae bacterium]|nr:M42 family metallopeptidase [Anaerolineae bacterium]